MYVINTKPSLVCNLSFKVIHKEFFYDPYFYMYKQYYLHFTAVCCVFYAHISLYRK